MAALWAIFAHHNSATHSLKLLDVELLESRAVSYFTFASLYLARLMNELGRHKGTYMNERTDAPGSIKR